MKVMNPILMKIDEREEEIKKEVALREKKQKVNKIVVTTSLVLLSGTLIGVVRILTQVLQ
ncbi:hypothetical protein NH621_09930 [Lactococcus formosensis]|uniref:hypothetical protein n=1 Tax=Lactococcus TaxID=1357 RepID=UPI002097B6A6|nr:MULTISPECIES: hypothetical protein [Lactococcus]MCO7181489.1 hypothetical protein [Lactococcus formosensis]